MPTYKCLRREIWFRGFMFKRNDEYTGEPPVCGKGTDLTKGSNPCFRLVAGSREVEAIPEPEDADPRTDAEIRDDIFRKYGEKTHPNMKRKNLLAKEKDLLRLKGMDAGDSITDYEVLG